MTAVSHCGEAWRGLAARAAAPGTRPRTRRTAEAAWDVVEIAHGGRASCARATPQQHLFVELARGLKSAAPTAFSRSNLSLNRFYTHLPIDAEVHLPTRTSAHLISDFRAEQSYERHVERTPGLSRTTHDSPHHLCDSGRGAPAHCAPSRLFHALLDEVGHLHLV